MNGGNPDPALPIPEGGASPDPDATKIATSPPRLARVIDASMLAAATPLETRQDFEHELSYWQPLTIALVVLLLVIFTLQLIYGTLASEEAIIAAGALKRSKVLDGEWWRLLSAVFLHGSFDHLIGNCLVLYVLGIAVEHAYGWLRLLGVFLVSGVAGSLLSASMGEGPSVGASGAIFGLIGCLTAFFYRFRDRIYFREKRLGGVLLFWVGYAVITGFLTPLTDNWAHIGGLIGGAGSVLTFTPRAQIFDQRRPNETNTRG